MADWIEAAKRVLALNNAPFVDTLRFLALISSLTCIRVLASRKLAGSSVNKFLLCGSICDFLYTALMLVHRIFTGLCAEMDSEKCGVHVYLIFQLLYVYVSEYLTSCLGLLSILVEIFLTVHRIFLITKKSRRVIGLRAGQVCPVLITVAFLAYSPVLLSYTIEPYEKLGENETIIIDYKISKTKFGLTAFAAKYMSGLNATRIFLVTFVLLFLNIIVLVYFQVYSSDTNIFAKSKPFLSLKLTN